eukprot:GFYU01000137.1.p1 GENE.GFYU01000137.1~~GFYU01000137.1.p1  ORF type:complete len:447 (-),score=39.14 GFYU01000137.1:38-1228(-)
MMNFFRKRTTKKHASIAKAAPVAASIVLNGGRAVGKTSVMMKLRDPSYVLPQDFYHSQIVIEFTSLRHPDVYDLATDKEFSRVLVWDMLRQFHLRNPVVNPAMTYHKRHSTQRMSFLVYAHVFDLTAADDDIARDLRELDREMLKLMHESVDLSYLKVLVLGNKADLEGAREMRNLEALINGASAGIQQLRERHIDITFIEISALTGKGMHELRAYTRDLCLQRADILQHAIKAAGVIQPRFDQKIESGCRMCWEETKRVLSVCLSGGGEGGGDGVSDGHTELQSVHLRTIPNDTVEMESIDHIDKLPEVKKKIIEDSLNDPEHKAATLLDDDWVAIENDESTKVSLKSSDSDNAANRTEGAKGVVYNQVGVYDPVLVVPSTVTGQVSSRVIGVSA